MGKLPPMVYMFLNNHAVALFPTTECVQMRSIVNDFE